MSEGKVEIEITGKGGEEVARQLNAAEEAAKAAAAAAEERNRKQAEWDAAAAERRAQEEPRKVGGGFGKAPDIERENEATRVWLDQKKESIAAEAEHEKAVREFNERLDERVAKIHEEIDALEEEEESAKKKDAVEGIARVQKAQVLSQLAGQVSQIGRKFQEVADDVEVFDAVLADKLRSSGETIEKVSGAVGSMALGFALGGPLGAAAAGLGSAISELAGSYVEAGQSAVEMEAKSAAAFDSLVDRMGKVAGQKSALELKEWLQTLTEEEAGITRQNQALERNRQLLEAKLAAQSRLDTAKAASEIAAIDADPNLSDAEKVRKKAAVTEALEKKRVEDTVRAQGRDVAAAEEDAKAKEEAARRAAEDAAAVAARKAAEDEERTELERREAARKRAIDALPAASAEAATATRKAELLRRIPFLTGPQEDAEAKQERLEDLRNTANRNPQDAVRLEELRKVQAATDAAAAKAAADAAAAKEAAEKAKLDAAGKREILQETLPLTAETYQTEAGSRATRTAAAAAAAEKRAKDQQEAREKREREKAEAEERRRLQEEVERREQVLDGTAREAGLGIRGRGARSGNTLLEGIGKTLADGTNGAEIQKVGDDVKAGVAKLGAANVAALRKVLDELGRQQQEIENLRGQIRKGRDLR